MNYLLISSQTIAKCQIEQIIKSMIKPNKKVKG